MAHPFYGCVSPNANCKEYPVAASQYFRHDGVNAVYLDGSGYVTLALSATATFIGVAKVPVGKGAGASSSYWLSSATAGSDYMSVITDPAAIYLVPAGTSAKGDTTITDSHAGNLYDLVAVNDGTDTYVNLNASTTDMFVVVGPGSDYGGATTDIAVRINPLKFQADT